MDPGPELGMAPECSQSSVGRTKANDTQRLDVLKSELHPWGHRTQRTRQRAGTLPLLLHTG